ncbi:recombination protein RecR [bacterium]|nr:recombination protein RecR [bacterium]|tara:strand:+ start:20966 stop:21571 length:606 start_codon:yes stop_codon:yes gene_type:complete
MSDDQIEKLTELFKKFPGVGPRQARRFVYYLIHKDNSYLNDLTESMKNLRGSVLQCSDCKRFYAPRHENDKKGTCMYCIDENREATLLIVEKDADLENIEKTDTYKGHYFVLGGLVPVLEKEPEKRVRIKHLKSLLGRKKMDEVIVALAAHMDGDHTAEYLKKELSSLSSKVTLLGRGLSTGTELEYSDSDTLKNALKNRG